MTPRLSISVEKYYVCKWVKKLKLKRTKVKNNLAKI
jgi:hypothetical protein